MNNNENDRGGFEIDLEERIYNLAEVVAFAQENFPQQGLDELWLLKADDGKIIVGVRGDAPTKPN